MNLSIGWRWPVPNESSKGRIALPHACKPQNVGCQLWVVQKFTAQLTSIRTDLCEMRTQLGSLGWPGSTCSFLTSTKIKGLCRQACGMSLIYMLGTWYKGEVFANGVQKEWSLDGVYIEVNIALGFLLRNRQSCSREWEKEGLDHLPSWFFVNVNVFDNYLVSGLDQGPRTQVLSQREGWKWCF